MITLYEKLKSQIVNYNESCLKYIKDTFESIISYKGENRDNLLRDSSNFSNFLISLVKVKEKTVHFNNYLDTDTLIKESSNLLSA